MSDIYESVTTEILSALMRGTIPWKRPWKPADVPVSAVTGKAYRGVNSVLLGITGFDDNRWLTVRQANELGGKVRAGERSRMAILWKTWTPNKREGETEEELAKRAVPMLRHYNVFNVSQCEGLGLAERYDPPLPKLSERLEKADLMVKLMPDPPTWLERGDRAFYRPSDDLVMIPKRKDFRNFETFFATLFHELGHATGHPKRLNRKSLDGTSQYGSETYAREELVAELTSAFCCATVSLDNSYVEDSAAYIDGWMSCLRSDPKAMVIAAAQAQKAADHIRGVTYL